jgi:hypothetical protein
MATFISVIDISFNDILARDLEMSTGNFFPAKGLTLIRACPSAVSSPATLWQLLRI